MVDVLFSSAIQNVIERRFPEELGNSYTLELASLWSEVLEKIIKSSQDQFYKGADQLHVDLKPELVVALTNTVYGLAERIVSTRTDGKRLAEINAIEEREYHSSTKGTLAIEKSITTMTEAWRERYRERWEPKSIRKLAAKKVTNPPKKRCPTPVKCNHFISKFFLKKHWSEKDELTILSRDKNSGWKMRKVSVGSWGHEEGLYSDHLEDWFSLIEGDAEEPIRKILALFPLNEPENLLFLGYLIVQKMRNPTYREKIIDGTLPVSIRTVGDEKAQDPNFQRAAYETIFRDNKLYDQISRPLLWSRWVNVRVKKPVFILPDTFCIMTAVGDRKVLIAPLTPTACFVATGVGENEKSILPHNINDEALAILISDCLLASTKSEAVCHSEYPKNLASRPLPESLNLVMAQIDKHLSSMEG